jgi:hypothetical protein
VKHFDVGKGILLWRSLRESYYFWLRNKGDTLGRSQCLMWALGEMESGYIYIHISFWKFRE